MTFVLARQFGERILIVSDTMVENKSHAKSNIVPGELKAIVLNEKISVAYSGSVPLALDAIKGAMAVYNAGKAFDDVLEPLRTAAAATLGTDRETEFLVASHLDGPLMLENQRGSMRISYDVSRKMTPPRSARAVLRADRSGISAVAAPFKLDQVWRCRNGVAG